MPRVPAAWISASSRPCVTHTSGAPTSSSVAFSSSQSAWSEITSGSSTPRDFARCRTRIQPEAIATTGSASRRAQRSAIAPGGASTIAPTSSPFAADGRRAQIAERHAAAPRRPGTSRPARRAARSGGPSPPDAAARSAAGTCPARSSRRHACGRETAPRWPAAGRSPGPAADGGTPAGANVASVTNTSHGTGTKPAQVGSAVRL